MDELNTNFKELLESKIVSTIKGQFEDIKKQLLEIQVQNMKLKKWLICLSFVMLATIVCLVCVCLKIR